MHIYISCERGSITFERSPGRWRGSRGPNPGQRSGVQSAAQRPLVTGGALPSVVEQMRPESSPQNPRTPVCARVAGSAV